MIVCATTVAQCGHGTSHRISIGGDAIHGALWSRDEKPGTRKIALYSAGRLIWSGKTSITGRFEINHLSRGTYQIVARGWGRGTIELTPTQDQAFVFGQHEYWSVILLRGGCMFWVGHTN
jgi:hypothetical protein